MEKSQKKKIQVLQNIQLQKPTHPQERLRKLYPRLSPNKTKTKISFSESQDIYLPKNLANGNPEMIKDLDVNFNARYKRDPEPTLPIANGTKFIPFKNNFTLEKHVNLTKPKLLTLNERKPEYPKIKFSEEQEKKLDEAIQNALKEESEKRMEEEKLRKQSLTKLQKKLKNKMKFYQSNSFNSLNGTTWKNNLVTNTSNTVDGNQPGSSTKKLKETKQSIVSKIPDRTKSGLLSHFSCSSELPVKIKNKKSKDKDTVSKDRAISTTNSSGAVLETTSVNHKNNKKDILEVKSETFTEYKTDSNMPRKSEKKKDKNKENDIYFENLNNDAINIETQLTTKEKSSKKRKKTEDLDFLNSSNLETFINFQSKKVKIKEIKTKISFEYKPDSSKKSKSKKKKKGKTHQVTVKTEVFTEYESDSSYKSESSKKKKSKHLKQTTQSNKAVQTSKEMESIFNSTPISDKIKTPMFYPEISCIAVESSKNSKRNIKKEEEDRKEKASISEPMSRNQKKFSKYKQKTKK